MPTKKFIVLAAALALLAITAPASAATIDYLGADVSLNFPGNIFDPLTAYPRR
jgi:type 1 fimbria pilin